MTKNIADAWAGSAPTRRMISGISAPVSVPAAIETSNAIATTMPRRVANTESPKS